MLAHVGPAEEQVARRGGPPQCGSRTSFVLATRVGQWRWAARNPKPIQVIGDPLAGVLLYGTQAEDGADDVGLGEGEGRDRLLVDLQPGRAAIAVFAIAIGHHASQPGSGLRRSEEHT